MAYNMPQKLSNACFEILSKTLSLVIIEVSRIAHTSLLKTVLSSFGNLLQEI